MKTIGVDVGGTFTDLRLCDMETSALAIHKVSTTPNDPSQGVMTGIRELCEENGVDPDDIRYVFHGTTTATNAVLANKGARAGMITNDGFRDIIDIGRHQRVEHYSIMQELPWQSRPWCSAATARQRLAPGSPTSWPALPIFPPRVCTNYCPGNGSACAKPSPSISRAARPSRIAIIEPAARSRVCQSCGLCRLRTVHDMYAKLESRQVSGKLLLKVAP